MNRLLLALLRGDLIAERLLIGAEIALSLATDVVRLGQRQDDQAAELADLRGRVERLERR